MAEQFFECLFEGDEGEGGLVQCGYDTKAASFIDIGDQLEHMHPFFLTVAEEEFGDAFKPGLDIRPAGHGKVGLGGLGFHKYLLIQSLLHVFREHNPGSLDVLEVDS
jgi:hypothetical protein